MNFISTGMGKTLLGVLAHLNAHINSKSHCTACGNPADYIPQAGGFRRHVCSRWTSSK